LSRRKVIIDGQEVDFTVVQPDATRLRAATTVTAIRDVTLPMQSLILNHSFEQDLAGWLKIGTVQIDDTTRVYGLRSCKLGPGGNIKQPLPIPLGVDWMEQFYLWARSSVDLVDKLSVTYDYSDATSSTETFDTAVSWSKITLAPTAGKKIVQITIVNIDTAETIWIDDVTTVF